MLPAESLKGGKYFAVAAVETWMEAGTGALGDRDVDEPPLCIDGSVPAPVCLVNADSDEQGFHRMMLLLFVTRWGTIKFNTGLFCPPRHHLRSAN